MNSYVGILPIHHTVSAAHPGRFRDSPVHNNTPCGNGKLWTTSTNSKRALYTKWLNSGGLLLTATDAYLQLSALLAEGDINKGQPAGGVEQLLCPILR